MPAIRLSNVPSAYIVSNGRIFRAGSPDSLGRDPEVRRIYLGENFYFAPGIDLPGAATTRG